MADRLGQPFVPMVPAHVLRRVGTILERQVLRVRRFEQPEEPVGPHFVLFDAVDGQRVVKRRTSKQVPRGGIRRVHVAAGIDDERRSRVVILERQLIVVLVIPEAVRADQAVGDEQTVAARAHHRDPGVRKQTSPLFTSPNRQRCPVEIQAPPGGLPRPRGSGQRHPRRLVEHDCRRSKKMPRILWRRCSIRIELVQPSIVGIANLRHQAIGPCHRREKGDHAVQVGTVGV